LCLDYTRKTAQVVTDLQNKLQQGCCEADIRMCSHCLFPVVVTSLEQVVITLLTTRLMTVTDLLQLVPTRILKNSLIIHEENTKKNHKRVVSVYVIQIHVDLHKI
jgi:hypothetical protein